MADENAASAEDARAVREASLAWYVALNAMLHGDPEPFAGVYSHADDVTYMGAEGGLRVGWADADWKAQAAKSLGGASSLSTCTSLSAATGPLVT